MHSRLAFDRTSRDLEEMRTQNFGAAQREADTICPTDTPPVVPLNLVDRVCKELAECYGLPPTRTVTRLDSAASAAITRIFDRDWNEAFSAAAQQCVAQNAVVISIDAGRRLGRPVVNSWVPWQVTVVFDDPTRASGSIQDADRVEIIVPHIVEQTPASTVVNFATRVYTPEAAWLQVGKVQRPLIGGSIYHNLGYVPLAGMRRVSHRDGLWLPNLPEDILAQALVTTMAVSDWAHIMRHQSFTRDYWWGAAAGKMAREMPSSPRAAIVLDAPSVEDIGHATVQPNPPVATYIAATNTALEYFASARCISRTSLRESSGITGEAKAEERIDQERERRAGESRCQRFEREALQVCVDVLRLSGEPAFAAPATPEMEVRYQYVRPRSDALHVVQADAMMIAQGRSSPEELVARDEGMSLERATALVASRAKVPTEAETEPTPDKPSGLVEPAAAAGAEKEADTALNGAQVAALVEIAVAVRAGTLDPAQARAIIQVAFPVSAEGAAAIVGTGAAAKLPTEEEPA